jgi:pimeloyl-ACP methyl ester carboxylesterase
MSGQHVSAAGLRIYFEEYGEGKPLLFLHGGLCTIETFSKQVPVFLKHYRVLLPERRGHGRTPDVGGEFTYEVMVDDTIAFMDAMDLNDSVLVGHSDGANIALAVAVSRPDLVSKIVAISGTFSPDNLTPEERNTMRSWGPEDLRRFLPKLVADYERYTPDGQRQYPVVCPKVLKMWTSDWELTAEQLGSIARPTLIMSADRDLVPLHHTLKLFEAVPKAELCIAPGATHFLISEKPRFANDVILDFLSAAPMDES